MSREERINILVITLSNIGDVVSTTPVITLLRKRFPKAKLTVVVGPKAAPLLEKSRKINRLLVYDKRAGLPEKLKLVRTLREEFYHCVVDLRNSAFPFLVRAEERSPVFRSFQSKNIRERHLEIVSKMGLLGSLEKSFSDREPFDFYAECDESSLLRKLEARGVGAAESWVVAAPGGGSQVKQWPLEGFREVIARLLGMTGLKVAVVGDQKEALLGGGLCKVDPSRVINLVGAIHLRELAVLVSRAELVLTNDSAVMHLGYELGRSVVALFGPTDHERYGRTNQIWRVVREFPPCAPCRRAQCRLERRICLEDLSPNKVFQACQEILDARVSLRS